MEATLDAVYDLYRETEVKHGVRSETGWWKGVTLENRAAFKRDVLELKRRYPANLETVLREKLEHYEMYSRFGKHDRMSPQEMMLKELLVLDEKKDISLTHLNKRERVLLETTLLDRLKEVIMGEYALFCDLEFDLEKTHDDDTDGERQRRGKELVGIIDMYAEKAGANADSAILAIKSSLENRM